MTAAAGLRDTAARPNAAPGLFTAAAAPPAAASACCCCNCFLRISRRSRGERAAASLPASSMAFSANAFGRRCGDALEAAGAVVFLVVVVVVVGLVEGGGASMLLYSLWWL